MLRISPKGARPKLASSEMDGKSKARLFQKIFYKLHLYLNPICCFCFCFCFATSMFLSFQLDFLSLIGLLPTYFPLRSFIARVKSIGSLKLTNPKPRVLLVFLSRITFAFTNEGYRLKVLKEIYFVCIHFLVKLFKA
jgi:hypothetical protein